MLSEPPDKWMYNLLSCSHTNRLMHNILNTTLLTQCHCDVFRPSVAIFRDYDRYISTARWTQPVTKCTTQFSELSCKYVTRRSLNRIVHLLLICWPCCGNGSVVIPEDGRLRVETRRSDIVLIVCISRSVCEIVILVHGHKRDNICCLSVVIKYKY
jgi:hypothetical protein